MNHYISLHTCASSGRADPDCALGHILKALFKNDDFMNKLVNSYIMSTREDFELNCTAARLLLNVMPGLESSMVFQDTVSTIVIDQISYDCMSWPAVPYMYDARFRDDWVEKC